MKKHLASLCGIVLISWMILPSRAQGQMVTEKISPTSHLPSVAASVSSLEERCAADGRTANLLFLYSATSDRSEKRDACQLSFASQSTSQSFGGAFHVRKEHPQAAFMCSNLNMEKEKGFYEITYIGSAEAGYEICDLRYRSHVNVGIDMPCSK